MLEALHPDRIDLGLGRAPGTDMRTAHGAAQHLAGALRGAVRAAARAPRRRLRRHAAPSRASTRCRSCGCSARPTAGRASPARSGCRSSSLITSIRTSPSPHWSSIAACSWPPSCSTPRARSSPPGSSSATTTRMPRAARCRAGSRCCACARAGRRRSRASTEAEAEVARLGSTELAVVEEAIARAIVGSPQTVHAELLELVERTGADELMLTSQVADPGQRIESLERVARAFELTPSPART